MLLVENNIEIRFKEVNICITIIYTYICTYIYIYIYI